MGAFVLKNAYVTINGNAISDHVRECTVQMTADDVDVTAMGAGGHAHLAGLRDDRFTFSMYSDFAAGSVDELVSGTFRAAGNFTIHVAANGSVVTATNPMYVGTCQLLTYTPIGGAAGAVAMTPLEFVCIGTISAFATTP